MCFPPFGPFGSPSRPNPSVKQPDLPPNPFFRLLFRKQMTNIFKVAKPVRPFEALFLLDVAAQGCRTAFVFLMHARLLNKLQNNSGSCSMFWEFGRGQSWGDRSAGQQELAEELR